MLLTLLAFLMRFVDIPKAAPGSKQCPSGSACNKATCLLQHTPSPLAIATSIHKSTNSYSSSTSSGCDSNASSKENFYMDAAAAHLQQHHSITPQQLQQIRHYQQLQDRQLQLLQQQLLQRRRLQQELREQGVNVGVNVGRRAMPTGMTSSPSSLTCNQQYLRQHRMQQQQQHQQQQQQRQRHQPPQPHNKFLNDNDYLNNNIVIGSRHGNYGGIARGQIPRRGMTEISTANDISNKSHLSQQTAPLSLSPRHHNQSHSSLSHHLHHQHSTIASSPQIANVAAKHLTLKQNSNNHNNNQKPHHTHSSSISSANITSPTHSTSTLHYKHHSQQPTTASTTATSHHHNHHHQQHYQQQLQYMRGSKLPSTTTQSQYHRHLNDILQQQQQLQDQQQLLLRGGAKDPTAAASSNAAATNDSNADADANADANADELSEESLKQNVAIVLNNLNRYNNALRSLILNEEVNSRSHSHSYSHSHSSVLLDDSLLVSIGSIDSTNSNNNFLLDHDDVGGDGDDENDFRAMATAATPESDYNSNATTPGSRSNMMPIDFNHQQQQQQHLVGGVGGIGGGGGGGVGSNNVGGGNGGIGGGFCGGSNLNCSLASSHDFTHDNSDYQWFLDYGYRDGCGGMQRSVLSSLSASYNGFGDLIYYEDMAKNLDANLAEVDMESFRAEDIHSLLSHLPSYCKNLGSPVADGALACLGSGSGNSNRQMQQSYVIQQHMSPALQAQLASGHGLCQISSTSSNELIDNSICKSELLFSPVKESSHLSVGSLDMDAYPEDGDIILTCKANKDNYTIAFEGSMMYSDDSFYEPNEISMRNKQNFINLHSNLDDIVKRKSLEVSMSRSEQVGGHRGGPLGGGCSAGGADRMMRNPNAVTQLQRYPSGNNNTSADANNATVPSVRYAVVNCAGSVRKSNSLPNLTEDAETTLGPREQLLNVSSQAVSSMDVAKTARKLQERRNHQHRCCCSHSTSSSSAANSHNSSTMQPPSPQRQLHQQQSQQNKPAYNLVKLYIKQKSTNCSCQENQASGHTCMDVSSGCWPSSDAVGSSSSGSSLEQRLRKKSMNDSGKGSALSRHEEDRTENGCCAFEQRRSLAAEHSTPKKQLRLRNADAVFHDEDLNASSTGPLTAVTDSPMAQRRRSMGPLRHPQLSQLALEQQQQLHCSGSGGDTDGSLHTSDASRSNSEPLTQVFVSNGSGGAAKKVSRGIATNASSEMVTRSMQTSCGSMSTRSSLSERFRCVPPSFLAKLNNLGEECQAPIYVIYPNYALPDLGFVKTNSTADVIFSPFNYKMAIGNAASNAASATNSASVSSLKKRLSYDDDQLLKAIDYKHVMDWDSLATLLPAEYRQRLKHIPEVNRTLRESETQLQQRPLFCMAPPVRRSRSAVCDCSKYVERQTGEEGSSSSGSSQQPSSGYRGSSTLLTDSEMDGNETVRRMDSGVEMSPGVGRTPPKPMPRGILRKSSSAQSASKRNSMIEEHHTKLSKMEKRRSLQEPPYPPYGSGGSAEELSEVFEEDAELYAVPQRRPERLSRKDLDARARAENFLSSLPRSELKYYAEIAAILESSSEHQVPYDVAALKKEVSRVLSQQKKVSFNDVEEKFAEHVVPEPKQRQRFTNVAAAAVGVPTRTIQPLPRRCSQATADEQEQQKLDNNRFKRLQIQWELMSKDSNMVTELTNGHETKSAGTTPTAASAAALKSRIPRPVSYPAGRRSNPSTITPVTPDTPVTPPSARKSVAKCVKPVVKPQSINSRLSSPISTNKKTTTSTTTPTRITSEEAANGKTTRSPSRIVPPKRYSAVGLPSATSPIKGVPTTPSPVGSAMAGGARSRTPTANRTAVTAPNTPKRRVQSPRTIPRVR